MADKNMDFSRISEDEKINGIKITKVPKYIREKAYLTDFSETLAQLAEMIIQLGVNLSLDPDEALYWARKLQDIDTRLAQKAEQSALNVEKARIDSFTTLAAGSTTGDAELIDGRVDADGVTHANIGDAIRSIGENLSAYKEMELNEANFISPLPNGVANEIVKDKYGKYIVTKRVSDEYKLKESDILTVVRGVNIDRYQINPSLFVDALKTNWNNTASVFNVSVEGFFASPYGDSVDNYYSFYATADAGIYVSVPKDTYSTLAEAKIGLSGIGVYFELATPIVYTLPNNLSHNTKTLINAFEQIDKRNTGLTDEMVITMFPDGVTDKFVSRDGGFVFIKNTATKSIVDSDVTSLVTTNANVDFVKIRKPADSLAFGLTTLAIDKIFIEGAESITTVTDDSSLIGKVVPNADSGYLWYGLAKHTSLIDARNTLRDLKIKYQLKVSREIELSPEVSPDTLELVRQSIRPKLMPLITIAMDDGNSTDYDVYKMMQKKGMRGTSFVIGSNVLPGDPTSHYLTEERLKEMADNGWEIGCHTWGHSNLTLLPFPDGVIDAVSTNKKYLEGLTGKTVTSLAIPGGITNPSINNLIRSFYDGVRVSTGGYNNYGDVMNCYNIHTHWLDYPAYTVSYVKSLIDDLVTEDTAKWTVLSLHRLRATAEGDDWTLAEMEELADYLLGYQMQGKLEVVTLSEGVRRMKSHTPIF